MIIDIVKVFVPSIATFALGILLAPVLTNFLFKHQMWKKKAGKSDIMGNEAVVFNELHKNKEVGTPRMGGVIIWVSAGVITLLLWILGQFIGGDIFPKLDFLSRNQTWLPIVVLLLGSIVGLADDYLEIKGNGSYFAGGMSLKKRLLIVGLIGLAASLWFYFKLDISSIGFLGAFGPLEIGVFFIPFFVFVVLCLYSGGVIDGIDGLAGGVFATMFAAYAGVAFYQQQIDLAAFCAATVGGILAFLWFNIPPARFYMSETGTMGLTIALAIVAFMTDSLGEGHGILVLPIIAMPLVITVLSNVIQILSKKIRGKKIFRIAPLHHHFEAKGWPGYKITMRYWVVSVIFAILGMTIAFIS